MSCVSSQLVFLTDQLIRALSSDRGSHCKPQPKQPTGKEDSQSYSMHKTLHPKELQRWSLQVGSLCASVLRSVLCQVGSKHSLHPSECRALSIATRSPFRVTIEERGYRLGSLDSMSSLWGTSDPELWQQALDGYWDAVVAVGKGKKDRLPSLDRCVGASKGWLEVSGLWLLQLIPSQLSVQVVL